MKRTLPRIMVVRLICGKVLRRGLGGLHILCLLFDDNRSSLIQPDTPRALMYLLYKLSL